MSEIRTRLERVAERVSPGEDAFERLTRYRDNRRRTRRITAGLLAFAVAGGGIGVAVAALGGERSPRPPIDTPTVAQSPSVEGPGTSQTYDDPNGWTISYPAGWSVHQFQDDQLIRVTYDGVAISNFGAAGGVQDTSFLDSMPSDGVVIEVFQRQGGPLYIPTQPDTLLPISLAEFTRNVWIGSSGHGGAERTALQKDMVLNGEPFTMVVWLGSRISDSDRRGVEDAVSSFHARPLTPGTTTGRIASFYVLGKADGYAAGSVSRFDDSNLPNSELGRPPAPFYLVRTGPGFYALAWPNDLSRGYKDCPVTFDPATREFSCPNGAVWALDGSVVTNPDPSVHPDDPLSVLLVRISLDGHVLVTPNVSMGDTSLDLRLTGPAG
jgi:hypothetical protein